MSAPASLSSATTPTADVANGLGDIYPGIFEQLGTMIEKAFAEHVSDEIRILDIGPGPEAPYLATLLEKGLRYKGALIVCIDLDQKRRVFQDPSTFQDLRTSAQYKENYRFILSEAAEPPAEIPADISNQHLCFGLSMNFNGLSKDPRCWPEIPPAVTAYEQYDLIILNGTLHELHQGSRISSYLPRLVRGLADLLHPDGQLILGELYFRSEEHTSELQSLRHL